MSVASACASLHECRWLTTQPAIYPRHRSNPRSKEGGERDVFNEKPSREEQTIASSSVSKSRSTVASAAILHTTLGDIHLRLFPDKVHKTVENFAGLAKKGYYDGVIFHRVIRKFMLQTGDPLGDGTGGESLWGRTFEDEFRDDLKHDRPYTLSMANAGPGTNGGSPRRVERASCSGKDTDTDSAPSTEMAYRQAPNSSSRPSPRPGWTRSTPSSGAPPRAWT